MPANGDIRLNYQSGPVGGEEMIEVSRDDVVIGMKFVSVRVTGLRPQIRESFFRLTGQTDTHPNNHYGRQVLQKEISRLAFEYFQSRNATIGINDPSVISGGEFDLNGLWSLAAGHDCHKIGTSVDIDRFQESIVDGQRIFERIKNMGQHLAELAASEGINCRRIVEQRLENGKKICPVHFECPGSELGRSCFQKQGLSECIED